MSETRQAILWALAKGFNSQEIQQMLGMSRCALDTHVKKLKQHFGAETRENLIFIASEQGFFRGEVAGAA